MLRRIPLSIACSLLICAGLAVQASAQVNTASLTGLVTDAAGADTPNCHRT